MINFRLLLNRFSTSKALCKSFLNDLEFALEQNSESLVRATLQEAPVSQLDDIGISLVLSRLSKTNISPEEYIPKFQKGLSETEIVDSKAAASLIYVFSRLNCSFPEELLNKLFQKAIAGELESRYIAQLSIGISKSRIPVSSKFSCLNEVGKTISSRIQEFNELDRLFLLYSFSRFPNEHSESIIKEIIAKKPISEYGIRELAYLAEALSRFPLEKDQFLFSQIENQVLKINEIPKPSLVPLLHAFSKRSMGSEELYNFFQKEFERLFSNLGQKSVEVCLYSFHRAPFVSPDFVRKFEFCQVSGKNLRTISYWKNKKIS